ncbi:hypothetical protein NT01EI_1370 [Edwardsiella ictaluri 93-146]|uniref:Uncharacterized protein n=1 Tax=Edwardsiella ictaluri (strain 93-146) TaxID=634503 RepID=C5BD65_EDWI9|nr:hypothetical protein NT01EI_1370 [Edwardsiella ictaluri 93-146]
MEKVLISIRPQLKKGFGYIGSKQDKHRAAASGWSASID